MIAWIEIGLIFVALLMLYRWFSIYGLLAFIAFVAAIGGFVWLQATWQQADEDKVMLSFRHDLEACPPDKPISTVIVNGTDRTVSSVFFDLVVKRRGFSDESGRLSSVRSDKILKPREQYRFCNPLPSLREEIVPAEFDLASPTR